MVAIAAQTSLCPIFGAKRIEVAMSQAFFDTRIHCIAEQGLASGAAAVTTPVHCASPDAPNAVPRHQIGLDVAIPVIFPVAGQGVVAVARLWRLVVQQGRQDGVEVVIERSAM